MNYKYSLIIPHKNAPDLLEKALETVPFCQDLQVIVVDDNSNQVYQEQLNKLKEKYPDIIWIFDSSALGAGHARNIGLEHANGSWIIFMDADDELLENSLGIWDEATRSNEDSDIIYFNTETNSTDEGDRVIKKKRIISALQCSKDKLNDYLKFEFTEPWGKVIRHKFLRDNDIRFQESLVANDYMFSISSGYYAKNIAYWPISFYKAISRPSSLSNSALEDKKLKARLNVFLTGERFLNSHNVNRSPFSDLVSYIFIKHRNKVDAVKSICEENDLSYKKVIFNSLLTRILRFRNKAISK